MNQLRKSYKRIFRTVSVFVLAILIAPLLKANEPDSAYIFAYGMENGSGLYYAWSLDKNEWHSIGHHHVFLRSDYGRWGSQKRMYDPYIIQTPDKQWHCVWSLNREDGAIAYTVSKNLTHWKPQSYPLLLPQGNCLEPVIVFENQGKQFKVTWKSDKNTIGYFKSGTTNLKDYTAAVETDKPQSEREICEVSGRKFAGTVHKVNWEMIDHLINTYKLAEYKNRENAERVWMNPELFRDPVKLSLSLETSKQKEISDVLMGVFYEDISYAADGGLYAELVQNRGFEYHMSDKEYQDRNWNAKTAWSTIGSSKFEIDTANPIHQNNRHYAVLNLENTGSGLVNDGFDGIPVVSGDKYYFSFFVRSPEKKRGAVVVRLVTPDGKTIGETKISSIPQQWKKYEKTITVKETCKDAKLQILPQQIGEVHLDMISLFPQKTFKGRRNGLRQDLAQAVADLNPRFVRFPGGCVAHGDGLGNIYRWENTIGPLEARKPQRNIWGYHQSAGLGYFEYFQFCEDIGAEPVPILAAGVPCQNSAHFDQPIGGQQGGIPMDQMDDYVQTVLDLIEYANGDKNTTWGKKRAEAGHPEPFNLKYLGIGNEDLISDVFIERFTMIFNAVREKYPEIVIIGTAGPFCEGSDYTEGWNLATELGMEIIDEHYYQSPGWFLNNQDYYDRYSREKTKVYLGEYAAHIPGRHNNIETALTEALHLINVERNGDIVEMTSYAPLFAKDGQTRWNPDLIYFNNTEVRLTPGYYVQQLFGIHAGTTYIPFVKRLSERNHDVNKRIGSSFIIDKESNELIVKLVNLLPVSVQTSINLSDLNVVAGKSELTVLSGELGDRGAVPETSSLEVSGQFNYDMPEYSLSIIRVKLND
jgi:alpha-L-arabinofuranosidase